MPTVLVTGATGFIGRHLCALLLERGYAIRAVSRSAQASSGDASIEWSQLTNLADTSSWAGLLGGVDYVIHLAALAHQTAAKLPYAAYEAANVRVTQALATAVRDSSAKRMLYVSSIGAVRTYSGEPLDEESECVPDTDYGRTKRIAELAIVDLLAQSRADFCIVRPTLVFGPGNPGNMSRLIDLIKSSLPLPLGSIQNRRSFVYVGNLVDAIEKCLQHPAASRQVFNVSDNGYLSTPALVKLIGESLDLKVRLFDCPIPLLRALARIVGSQSEVDRLCGSLCANTSKIRSSLEWRPPFSTAEGLARTFSG